MTRIIAIANQKGGTGKTTTSINIASGLARARKKVLIVDLDPQSNCTAVFLGITFASGPRVKNVPTIYELLFNRAPVEECLYEVELSPMEEESSSILHILPSHLDLASAEIELVSAFERERKLTHAIKSIKSYYDYIIIDCAPSLGLLTVNALMAATEVLIPVDPGIFPLIGLRLLTSSIEQVQRANPGLHIVGVLPTLTDRTAMSRDTKEQLDASFGNRVFTSIPRRVAIGEAHTNGTDIYAYEPQSDGAKAYAQVVREIIGRK